MKSLTTSAHHLTQQLTFKSPFLDKMIERVLESSDKNGFSSKEKILFYKELVYMMKGGVPLMSAMDIVLSSSDNYAIKTVAQRIKNYLNDGKPLSYAISRMPEYFDEGDAAIIKTGEASGNLPSVLKSLSEEYAYLKSLKSKYIGAMIYPVALIIISFVAVIYLFAFVLPGIFDMIGGGVDKIPAITRFLMNMTDFFVSYWKNILVIFGVSVLLLIAYCTTERGKKWMYTTIIHLPIIGEMTKYYYLIKWARYLRLMISAGMDYVDTFRLLRDILKISLYQEMIEEVLVDISMGKPLYEPISQYSHVIPSNVAALIKVGEETANLEKAMDNVIELYQEELDHAITNFGKAIEPIILVVVGGIVTLIALGVFGLIFAVMDNIGKLG